MAGFLLLMTAVLILSSANGLGRESATSCSTRPNSSSALLLQLSSGVQQQQQQQLQSVPARCGTGHCVVPSGEEWVLDQSMSVETLTIRGTLTWDTSKDDLELRAGYILVESSGHLQVGTTENPMNLKATIYIRRTGHNHPVFGYRFLGGLGNAKVEIHGRTLTKTWTLLAQTAAAGSTVLNLEDDPRTLGWRVGDRVGIATTTPHTKNGRSTEHRIAGFGDKTITLDSGLQFEHWGGFREVAGRRFKMAAEVVNMERSVHVTGDDASSGEGLHTIMTGTGYMDMRYTRVDNCGQRPLMGRYCLHFHLMRNCPECVFQGNAVVDAQHVAITVHGTHYSKVDQNVVWDARAVGLYVEDGNEMHNTFSNNAVICTWWKKCSVDWVGGVASQGGGAFWIGMTNSMIGNHIVGHEIAWWTPGAFRGNGHGQAVGRTCPTHTPFGEIRDNVFHDNARFGIYLDNQFPRNLKRDDDGFLTDRSSCNAFTNDGQDNGVVNEVRNQFDWHNTYVGHYALGDIAFINFTSVNNGHAMYWKQSKNFADGRLWHVEKSTFAQDPSDFGCLQFLGPSGPFTFGVRDSVFLGSTRGGAGALQAGQHCGKGGAGGPCNVNYLLENVDFSGLEPGSPRIQFGVPTQVEDQGYVLPAFVAKDNSLGGFRSMVSKHLDGFIPEGCRRTSREWGEGIGCSQLVRRLNVWSPDSGRLKLSGPGYGVGANWAPPVGGRNSGELYYDSQHGGYGTPVLVGGSYSLSGNLHSEMIVEFSDQVLADHFGTPEYLSFQVGGNLCQLKSTDHRRFVTPMGHIHGWGWPLSPVEGHNRIRGGELRCGSSNAPIVPAPTPSPSTVVPAPSTSINFLPVCSTLPNVKQRCSDDGCKVLASGMTATHCSEYCESHGLMCNGAWEEVDNNCEVKAEMECFQIWPDTSDLICECVQSQIAPSPPPASPSPSPVTCSDYMQQTGCGWTDSWNCPGQPSGSKGPANNDGTLGYTCCCTNEFWQGISTTSAAVQIKPTTSPEMPSLKLIVASVGNVRILRAEGAQAVSTPGGEASPELRTIYYYSPDGKENGRVTYSGTNWPVVYVPGNIEMSEDLSMTFAKNANNVLLIDNRPAYQYVGDDEFSTDGNGAGGVWHWFQILESTTRPSTTSIASSSQSSAWVHHPGTNCYDDHGAAGIIDKSPFAGTKWLEECQQECLAEASCDAIVMLSGQNPSMCWLYKHVKLPECIPYKEYDTWVRAPVIESQTGTTSMATGTSHITTSVQATTTAPNELFFPVNGGADRACRGASSSDNLASYYELFNDISSLQSCKAKCAAEQLCRGIEYHTNGRCEVWTRHDGISSSIPLAGYTCLLYIGIFSTSSDPQNTLSSSQAPTTAAASSTLGQTTAAMSSTPEPTARTTSSLLEPTTTMQPTSTKAGVNSWDLHRGRNCYNGFGGTELGTPSGAFSIEACKAECVRSIKACEAVVMRSEWATSPCWLVGNVDINACQDYPDYDVHLRKQ